MKSKIPDDKLFIDYNIVKTQQSVIFCYIGFACDKKVKMTIKSDSYIAQCYAKSEV